MFFFCVYDRWGLIVCCVLVSCWSIWISGLCWMMFFFFFYRFSNKWFLNIVMNICIYLNLLFFDIVLKFYWIFFLGRLWFWVFFLFYRLSICWGWWGVGVFCYEDFYSWVGVYCMEYIFVGWFLCMVCGRIYNYFDKW